MTYQEAFGYLFSFTNFEEISPRDLAAENFNLKRVEHLLAFLGDPHLGRLTVHIAGTKGKGSTGAMTASVLQAAGYRTGFLSSPHLIAFEERIQIAGSPISQQAFLVGMQELRPAVEAYHQDAQYGRLTTFELMTALAFVCFQREGATAQVLEVGMGGRLDATNVIPAPDLCIITPISYDHTEVLGNTLAAIAGEKAGIIKKGCPVVMAPQEEEAKRVIAQRCYALDAPLIDVEKRAAWKRSSQSLDEQCFYLHTLKTGFELRIPLLGAFQMENAVTAVTGIELLRERGVPITREAIQQGLAQVRWPGRLQILERNPLLVVDGAHNVASARRLAEALQADLPHQRIFFVIGTSADKDIDGIAKELAPLAETVFVTRSASPRAAHPQRVADAFAAAGVTAHMVESAAEGIACARDRATADDLICATGSLYIVGDVLKHRLTATLAEAW